MLSRHSFMSVLEEKWLILQEHRINVTSTIITIIIYRYHYSPSQSIMNMVIFFFFGGGLKSRIPKYHADHYELLNMLQCFTKLLTSLYLSNSFCWLPVHILFDIYIYTNQQRSHRSDHMVGMQNIHLRLKMTKNQHYM